MNLYVITITLFSVAGIAVALYSGMNIVKKRRTAAWPSVEARIIASNAPSEKTQFLPQAIFSYDVDGQQFQSTIDIPSGESADPDFARRFLQQYALGVALTVFYNPAQPQDVRLSVGAGREDWLIFYLGLGAFALGLVFILSHL